MSFAGALFIGIMIFLTGFAISKILEDKIAKELKRIADKLEAK